MRLENWKGKDGERYAGIMLFGCFFLRLDVTYKTVITLVVLVWFLLMAKSLVIYEWNFGMGVYY